MGNESAVHFPGSRRIHIGLAVKDLQRSRVFYETLFGERPTKERAGYVKFEPQEPSVNLSLNETGSAGVGQDAATHYGIQVKSSQAVQDAIARFNAAGLDMAVEERTTCCYAVQDKVWVADPDGNRWEVFVVLDQDASQRQDAASSCCATDAAQGPSGGCC